MQAIAAAWFEMGSVVILASVLYASIRTFAVPPATILLLLFLFSRLMPRIMGGQQHYREFLNDFPAYENMVAIEARCVASVEPRVHPHNRLSLKDQLTAEDLSFTYGDGRAPALHNLSLIIPAGKIVALVGPSGAGNSTLADILMGLVAPDRGRVRVDGIQLDNEAMRGWREQIVYIARHVPIPRHYSR